MLLCNDLPNSKEHCDKPFFMPKSMFENLHYLEDAQQLYADERVDQYEVISNTSEPLIFTFVGGFTSR